MAAVPVVIGSVSLDENLVGGRRRAKLGGVVTYASLCLARCGTPPLVVTRAAARDWDKLGPLRRAGVQLRVYDSAQTTRFENRELGSGREQRVSSRAQPISAELLLEAASDSLEQAPFVLLGPLHEEDVEPSVVELLAKRTDRVAMDVQGFVRQVVGTRVRARASRFLEAALRGSRVVKASREELGTIEQALGRDAEGIVDAYGLCELLITDGSRGGCLIVPGAERLSYNTPSTEVVDPTGAGDVFFAVYLHATRVARVDFAEALRRAARAAALQVGGHLLDEALVLQSHARTSS